MDWYWHLVFYYRANVIQQTTVKQIRAILRQITASVSYLPELDTDDCKWDIRDLLILNSQVQYLGTFNVLVYANKDVEVPEAWGDSGPLLIVGGGEHVRLQSINTLVHKVDSFVAYKLDETF